MTALAEEWDDIHDRLTPQASERLVALTDDFTHEGDRNVSEDIAARITLLLRDNLPADHAVIAELSKKDHSASARHSTDPTRRATELSGWFKLAEPLRRRLGTRCRPPPRLRKASFGGCGRCRRWTPTKCVATVTTPRIPT
ncbi:hypothetical protein GCM10010411_75090 [Actinomadura fulvescens]|uniref:Uncharacterized protein n=2 Tax=Actinomadura fulvescens TaxID=46160 RepID=A0ABN3QI02_9ACTN